MSRRRYISTDISLDKRVNKLATKHSDFAVMLYTWMIPHAGDDAIISADPEELMFMVIPGRRDKTEEDIVEALTAMDDLELIYWDRENDTIYFPTSSFYKYQTYIKQSNRRYEEAEKTEENNHQRKTPQNAEENNLSQKSTEKAVSPPPSLSPSPSLSSSGGYDKREAKVIKIFQDNFRVEPNSTQQEKLNSYLDDGMEPELIEKAITITKENGKDLNYLWGILNRLIESGIKTVVVFDQKERERRRKTASSRGQPNKKKEKVPDYILQQEQKYHQNNQHQEEVPDELKSEISEMLKAMGEDP